MNPFLRRAALASLALAGTTWSESRTLSSQGDVAIRAASLESAIVAVSVVDATEFSEESLLPSTGEPSASPADVPRRLMVRPHASLPPRCAVPNPPSHVRPGPLIDRVIPDRHARPYNRGVFRYEPRIGDIRDVPHDYTLPGGEGQRETLWVIPPRDSHGFFVLRRG